MRIVIASEDWYQGLPDAERAIVDEGVRLATKANRDWLRNRAGILEKLEAAGIIVTRLAPEERARFVEASRKLYSAGVLTPEQVQIWTDAAGK